MAKSIRDFVSDVSNDLKALNIDAWISPKVIYEKGLDITADFLKKDNSSNLVLYTQVENWMELPCIEMEEIPLTSCGLDVYICSKVMKSKKKLPDILTSKVSPLIKEVASTDYSKTYNYISSFTKWKNTQKQEFISKRYFLILEGYLYIPIGKKDGVESPEKVTMTAYFREEQQVEEFNNGKQCKKLADYTFICPSYLINDVKKETFNQFRQIYLQIQSDDLPNMSSTEKTNPKNIG